MKLNEKGQAAITDALFFLMIVVALCAFLFFYANNYGADVDRFVQSKYLSSYASASLQTILYSSTPRDPNQQLSSPEVKEVDYLITLVKEDFASHGELTPDVKTVLKQNVFNAMKPVVASNDYLFYIVDRDYDRPGCEINFPIFVLLHLSETTVHTATNSAGKEVTTITTEDKNYFCEPYGFPEMDGFIISTGASAQAKIPLMFKRIEKSGTKFILTKGTDTCFSEGQMAGIVLWTPTQIDKSLYLNIFAPADKNGKKISAMQCVDADQPVAPSP